MDNTSRSEDTTNQESKKPEIILNMDSDAAEMVEEILTEGGVKPDVIRHV